MDIRNLLRDVAEGTVSVDEAVLKLKKAPFEDLGFAKLDYHRALRQGVAEVIYGAGKTSEQIVKIVNNFWKNGQKNVLITRMSEDAAKFVVKELRSDKIKITYDAMSKIGIVGEIPQSDGLGKVVVATGGTSDMPVAEEAALTAEVLGNEVVRLYDVGVAGLHRLLSHADELMSAKVVIAIAGMEGA